MNMPTDWKSKNGNAGLSPFSLPTLCAQLWSAMPEPIKNLYRRVPVNIRELLYTRFLPNETVVSVRRGLVRDMRMVIKPRTEMGYFLGNHEEEVQEVLPQFVKLGMTVFNIGANIGFFSLGLARLVGSNGHVVAFEPNPAAVKRLMRNIEFNQLQSVISVEAVAAGEFDGDASFSFALTESQGRFSDLPYVPKDAATVSITCTTIDTYAGTTGLTPDLLLIDVEHAEGRVLCGMRKLLQDRKPVIVIEMHGQQAIDEAYAELREREYHLFSIDGLKSIGCVADVRELGHYVALPSRFESAEFTLSGPSENFAGRA